MKLTPTNPNWQVKGIAPLDANAPNREAMAKANATRAWGSVYEDAGHKATVILNDITKQSNIEETNRLYSKAAGLVNDLENRMYTEQQIPMDDAIMTGVQYDDSYEYMDEQGKMVKNNRGYASMHEVGASIWAVQTDAIAKSWAAQGSNSTVQGAVAAKLRDTLLAKTQNVGRHITNLAIADRKATVDMLIEDQTRSGDLNAVIDVAAESLNRGIIDQEKFNTYVTNANREIEVNNYQMAIESTTKEHELASISTTALTSTGWMTPAQKMAVSNASLSKLERIRAERKVKLGEWQDNNEVESIKAVHNGSLSVDELFSNSYKYDRAGFTRMYDRLTDPTPRVSDKGVLNDYQTRILSIPYQSTDEYPMEDISDDIMDEMRESVLKGTLTPDDFNENVDAMTKVKEAPFKTQQYQQTKKSLFVDILGTIDPVDMQEINSAGVNVSAILLKKLGQSENVSVLAIKAYNDMNAYMRTYGPKADPITWWEKNKDAYKLDNYENASAEKFANTHSNEVVKLSSGRVDIEATRANLVAKYKNGHYGEVGSIEAQTELNKRVRELKGLPNE